MNCFRAKWTENTLYADPPLSLHMHTTNLMPFNTSLNSWTLAKTSLLSAHKIKACQEEGWGMHERGSTTMQIGLDEEFGGFRPKIAHKGISNKRFFFCVIEGKFIAILSMSGDIDVNPWEFWSFEKDHCVPSMRPPPENRRVPMNTERADHHPTDLRQTTNKFHCLRICILSMNTCCFSFSVDGEMSFSDYHYDLMNRMFAYCFPDKLAGRQDEKSFQVDSFFIIALKQCVSHFRQNDSSWSRSVCGSERIDWYH